MEGRCVGIVEGGRVAGEKAVRVRVAGLQREIDAEGSPDAGAVAGEGSDDARLERCGLSAVSARAALADGCAGRGNRIPAAAEAGQPFALGLSRLGVLDEVVERVAGVGDLEAPVPALARPEQAGLGAAARRRTAVGDERWPVRGAVAVAGAPPALVVRPQVERLAVGVDEDPAELARTGL